MNFSIIGLIKNKSIIYTVISQIVTLAVSLLMTIGMTSYLTVEAFGYWQLFVFYASYIGLAHFGICDGLYLKYGGKTLEDLDKSEIKGVFFIYFVLQLLVGLFILLYGLIIHFEYERKYIIYAISILVTITNFQTLMSYILLATNNIIENSKSVFIEKLTILILIITLIIFKTISFENLIISYFVSKLFSLFYLSSYFKSILKVAREIDYSKFIDVIRVGSILMLSNIVSTLIIGVSRYFIDRKWDIVIFGKISLSISLVYFILVLLSQASLILFPYLRTISEDKQREIFINVNCKISFVLKICIIAYLPFTIVLYKFLPNYIESVNYLILLLPICLFDGKMQILFVPYFKNLFLQKKLLHINILCLVLSLLFTILGAYYYESILIILLGLIISLGIRSILAEIIINRKYKILQYRILLLDISFSILIVLYFFCKNDFFNIVNNLF